MIIKTFISAAPVVQQTCWQLPGFLCLCAEWGHFVCTTQLLVCSWWVGLENRIYQKDEVGEGHGLTSFSKDFNATNKIHGEIIRPGGFGTTGADFKELASLCSTGLAIP